MSESGTLLVVDDLPANRDLLARRLERCGFRVLQAASGAEALELVGRSPVECVLLDIAMPGMSGLDVLRTLRATRSSSALPVIMVTAKTDSEDVVEALSLGANDYVTKPVDFPVALARIKAHLRTRQAAAVATEPGFEPRSPAQAGPGALLGGRYVLESLIGGGSFGSVFRARHVDLGQNVAVKVLGTSAGTDIEALARFRREGASACRVQHPNVVAVLDFGVNAAGVAYLVMELLEGHSLEREIERLGSVEPRRAAEILVPVCSALAAAHAAGVVHRDVKPSNVFLHRSARGEEVPKVLDFGIAKIAGDVALGRAITLDGSLLGTPAYMAPERFRRGPYGPKSDVYSLGTVLYEMLSGRLPFLPPSSDPMALMAMQVEEEPPPLPSVEGLTPALEKLVRRTLSKDPEQRPSAEDLGHLLAAALLAGPFTPVDE